MNEATGATKKVGVRELKNSLSAYLDRVQAGEEIIVTAHGRPVARITPLSPETDRLAELISAGLVIPSTQSRRPPPRRVRLRGPGSVADLVAEQRR